MTLQDLGYSDTLENQRIEQNLTDFEIGRVIAEHKERYIVRTGQGELEAEITGNMRFSAQSREDFPAVGDWVALQMYDPDFAIIHKILPRSSTISRQAVGQHGEVQIIATNIDMAFLVQAVDRDFNLNRLERYLTICYAAKVRPVVVLTKTDLIEPAQLAEIVDRVKARHKELPVEAVSSETLEGIEALKRYIKKGKTYCMLGSSGVGKSTLINTLSGEVLMKTDAISQSTQKGRHVTTHRELIVLESGGVLIDNPGMREVGIVDSSGGLETTFDEIAGLSEHCKFSDCSHTNEAGCAVLEALHNGELDEQAYRNFMKMQKEQAHFQMTSQEKRKKDKDFGKMLKNYKKNKRNYKP